MFNIDTYAYPEGLRLLGRWQSGDLDGKLELTKVIDAAIAGELDNCFKLTELPDRVHTTACMQMLGLGVLNDLYGIESWEYYNVDAYRFVRVSLALSKLLGVEKPYVTWALYALTCEPLGQKMMYPDKYPPGSDPDTVLIDKNNWHKLKTPDFTTGIPKMIDEILRVTEELTGLPPMLQLSAPYSLAADIYGQEPLLADVVHDPDTVNALLDHLGDVVLGPWMDHFYEKFPNGWVELSDASGSPFFIGPENCKNISIRAIKHMLRDKPYADRVFCNNYRGDFTAEVKKKDRKSRRKTPEGANSERGSLEELTNAKVSVNHYFIMRLDADKVDVSFYEDQAIQRKMALTSGISSPQTDRNTIEDMYASRTELAEIAKYHVDAIRRVCEATDLPENTYVASPWPSHLYFEDINGQTSFELVEVILQEVFNSDPFERRSSA
tara:strand:- start:3626 stop:4939 length:1314 start_codon:yes stop_codon:yes gene_type:complete